MSQEPFQDFQIPPELRRNIEKFSHKFKDVLRFWPGILLLFIAFTSFVQIETEEVGVITRFGKYVRTMEPGLGMKMPFFEKLYRVPVENQQKLEFGFRTKNPGVRTEYDRDIGSDESLMLTGDLNLADVEWVVQYRIEDAYNYLFKVRNPQTTLRDISEAAMRQIVGDRTVNEVITVGRTEIGGELQVVMQQMCNEYSLGVKIEQVVLQDVNPPELVRDAWNEVNKAEQIMQTLINEAKQDYNKIIPRAQGEADEIIQKAEGYAKERTNIALGEASRFEALYKEYSRAPQVTKKRIYLETMSKVMPRLGNVIITDDKGNNVLPLLQMSLNNKKNTDGN